MVTVRVEDVDNLKERSRILRGSVLEAQCNIGDGMKAALKDLGLWE